MKNRVTIAATSDIHMKDVNPPKADLLLVSGDMTFRATRHELEWYEEWLTKHSPKYKYVVWTAGNHELGLEKDPKLARSIAQRTGTVYLEHESVTLLGLNIFGSPKTPDFYNWAFMYPRGTDTWKEIPDNTDILITHGPPHKILDLVYRGEHVGCWDLRHQIETRLKQLKLHVFGHIHCAYGYIQINGIDFANVAACNEKYEAVNPPMFFEYEVDS